MCKKEIDFYKEADRDLAKEISEVKKKMDIYMGITADVQQKFTDSINWNIQMIERSILKSNCSISPKRGEIWLVDLGINIGAEMSKERPCIVVSYDEYNDKSDLTTVIPITRAKHSHLTQFVITEDCLYSIYDKLEGTVKAEQITTKSKLRFKAKIGELNELGLKKLNIALINHLGLQGCCNEDIKTNIEDEASKFREREGFDEESSIPVGTEYDIVE